MENRTGNDGEGDRSVDPGMNDHAGRNIRCPRIFVDARDLSERLDVSYDTVLTWVRRGKIPHVRDGRGRLMFNLNSVIESLCQKPRDDSPTTRSERGEA